MKSRFSGLRHFEIDVPFDSHSMSERFSDVIFLVSPLFDARFKIVWLDNLHIDVKAKNMPTGTSNEANRITTITSMKGDDASAKRKCLFPYLNDNNKKISSH